MFHLSTDSTPGTWQSLRYVERLEDAIIMSQPSHPFLGSLDERRFSSRIPAWAEPYLFMPSVLASFHALGRGCAAQDSTVQPWLRSQRGPNYPRRVSATK
jgi:hypothetical protein